MGREGNPPGMMGTWVGVRCGGYDIRTVQAGDKDVKTTMIYTQVLNRAGAGDPNQSAQPIQKSGATYASNKSPNGSGARCV